MSNRFFLFHHYLYGTIIWEQVFCLWMSHSFVWISWTLDHGKANDSSFIKICALYEKSFENECQTLIQNGAWSLLFSHSSSKTSMKMYSVSLRTRTSVTSNRHLVDTKPTLPRRSGDTTCKTVARLSTVSRPTVGRHVSVGWLSLCSEIHPVHRHKSLSLVALAFAHSAAVQQNTSSIIWSIAASRTQNVDNQLNKRKLAKYCRRMQPFSWFVWKLAMWSFPLASLMSLPLSSSQTSCCTVGKCSINFQEIYSKSKEIHSKKRSSRTWNEKRIELVSYCNTILTFGKCKNLELDKFDRSGTLKVNCDINIHVQ